MTIVTNIEKVQFTRGVGESAGMLADRDYNVVVVLIDEGGRVFRRAFLVKFEMFVDDAMDRFHDTMSTLITEHLERCDA